MLNKNDEIILEILDNGISGEGIAKTADGVVVFVPFALKGEIVKAHIIKASKKFCVGKLIEVVKPAKERVKAPCPYFARCGGCAIQHIDYKKQLEIKTQNVKTTLEKQLKQQVVVNDCVASNPEYGYRNKMQMPIASIKGKTVCGMFAVNSHRIVETPECLLESEKTNKILYTFMQFLKNENIEGYVEGAHSGLVRHLVVRENANGTLVTVVINGKELPKAKKLFEQLSKIVQNLGLYVNINTQITNLILGKKFVHIAGIKEIQASEHGIIYPINPMSFVQVNDFIKDKIYTDVINLAKQSSAHVVIDAYAGAGLLTALLGKHFSKAYGIEIVGEAVEAANDLVRKNDITNQTNIVGDCAVELPKLVKNIKQKCLVVLDPPRAGCDGKVLEALIISQPEEIIYISCNPATLARDLSILNAKYKIANVQPYDMFPQTHHVETVVWLTKK